MASHSAMRLSSCVLLALCAMTQTGCASVFDCYECFGLPEYSEGDIETLDSRTNYFIVREQGEITVHVLYEDEFEKGLMDWVPIGKYHPPSFIEQCRNRVDFLLGKYLSEEGFAQETLNATEQSITHRLSERKIMNVKGKYALKCHGSGYVRWPIEQPILPKR